MQVFGLPRQVTRSATAVSCLEATESGEAAHRREILARWQQARDDGLTADQAARAVPRSTLYRWQKSPEPRSRRPKRVRQPDWSPELVAAVREIRTDFPLWGKARITVLLHRRGHRVSESTAFSGSSWSRAPSPRCQPCDAGLPGPYGAHAKRLPKGLKPSVPGEIVQLDTVTINPGPGRPTVKQFTARLPSGPALRPIAAPPLTTPNSSSTRSRPTGPSPSRPSRGIGVQGRLRDRNIILWELPPKSPELNGHVERNNGTWRYEFHATWDLPDNLEDLNPWLDAFADEFNTFRPHQALGGMTPAESLATRTADEPSPSHM